MNRIIEEHKEILKIGTMVFASWRVFEIDEREIKKLTWLSQTWSRRPLWSPLIVVETLQEGERERWKNLFITFYDVSYSTYFKWNFEFCVKHLDDYTIHFT